MDTQPTDKYASMHGEQQDVPNTAVAAFVIGMNILRSLRTKGLISQPEFNDIVENAIAVSGVRQGSGARNHLYGNLSRESRQRQDTLFRGDKPRGRAR